MFKNGMSGMLKKAQEMQENMKKMQEDLANQQVTGQSGAGAVSVTLNGHYDCVGVHLSTEALSEDKEMVEALIAAAINDAAKRVQKMTQEKMASVTGGIDLAGLKLPF